MREVLREEKRFKIGGSVFCLSDLELTMNAELMGSAPKTGRPNYVYINCLVDRDNERGHLRRVAHPKPSYIGSYAR